MDGNGLSRGRVAVQTIDFERVHSEPYPYPYPYPDSRFSFFVSFVSIGILDDYKINLGGFSLLMALGIKPELQTGGLRQGIFMHADIPVNLPAFKVILEIIKGACKSKYGDEHEHEHELQLERGSRWDGQDPYNVYMRC